MPGYSGGPVVTMLVCFILFRTRGRGCIGRPAFPTPSFFLGERTDHSQLGRIAPRDRGVICRFDVTGYKIHVVPAKRSASRDPQPPMSMVRKAGATALSTTGIGGYGSPRARGRQP